MLNAEKKQKKTQNLETVRSYLTMQLTGKGEMITSRLKAKLNNLNMYAIIVMRK